MINFQSSGKRTLKNLAAGKLKIDVLDCTLANGSVTPTIPGINWIPIKPATNAAFCAALVQKIIADKTYNADAISFTTQKAAVEGGYGAYTNATYLVIVDENHPNYRKLMRAADAGIDAPEKKDKDGKAVEQYVVIDAATGQPALHSACSKGTLEYEGEVNGVKVRTGFSLLTETVNEYTMDEYAEITGVRGGPGAHCQGVHLSRHPRGHLPQGRLGRLGQRHRHGHGRRGAPCHRGCEPDDRRQRAQQPGSHHCRQRSALQAGRHR